jgi:hypothetical protein
VEGPLENTKFDLQDAIEDRFNSAIERSAFSLRLVYTRQRIDIGRINRSPMACRASVETIFLRTAVPHGGRRPASDLLRLYRGLRH